MHSMSQSVRMLAVVGQRRGPERDDAITSGRGGAVRALGPSDEAGGNVTQASLSVRGLPAAPAGAVILILPWHGTACQ